VDAAGGDGSILFYAGGSDVTDLTGILFIGCGAACIFLMGYLLGWTRGFNVAKRIYWMD
jgi:hypothetical protein